MTSAVPARGGTGGRDRNGRIVDPVKVARAYEQLAALLRERITSGDLREGERLPSEVALAEQAGVSRSTVREALRTLQEAGLIVAASPRVMVVARRDEDPAFRELRHELRRRNVTFHHLHEALVDARARAGPLRGRARRRGRHPPAAPGRRRRRSATSSTSGEWSRLDEEFHLAIAEMSGNPALIIARAPIIAAAASRCCTASSAPRPIRSTRPATTAASSARSRRAIRTPPRR